MALNIFNRDKKKEEKKDAVKATDDAKESNKNKSKDDTNVFKVGVSADTHKILKGFYVSEKTSMNGEFNQYAFKVFKKANKPEIIKEVGKLFDVKVKKVQIINMPKKRRDIGKHPGFKPGFKKAIVVLEKGYEIKQSI
jgi:large subunit ribosomal protein L23